MPWRTDRDKQRPSVNGKRAASGRREERKLRSSDAESQIEERAEKDRSFSTGGTHRMEHVDVSIEELLSARNAASKPAQAVVQAHASSDAAQDASASAVNEIESNRRESSAGLVGDEAHPFVQIGERKEASSERARSQQPQDIAPESEPKQAEEPASEEEPQTKPFTASQALVAFAAASAREVPAPKKKKKIPASLLRGLNRESASEPEKEERKEEASVAEKPQEGADAAARKKLDSFLPAVEVFDVTPPVVQPQDQKADLDDSDDQDIEVRGKHAAHARPSQEKTDGVEQFASVKVDAAPEKPEELQEEEAEAPEQADLRPSVGAFRKARPAARRARVALDPSDASDDGAEKNDEAASADAASADAQDESESAGKPERPSVKGNVFMEIASKVSLKQLGITAGIIVVVIAIIAAVACFGFGAHLNKSITLKDEALEEALAPIESKSDPFYTLVAVEYARTSRYYEGPELLALVRTDPQAKVATVISIPATTQVSLSDSSYHPISEAQVVGGDAYLVSTVSQLMNVDIAHFIRTDDTGLANIVDRLGGIEVEVPETVNDSDVGDVTVAQGKQTLDGKSVVALTRADNYEENPIGIQSSNQQKVVSALLGKLVETSGMNYVGTVSDFKNDFKTDMTGPQLKSALRALVGADGYKTYTTILPGELDVSSDDYEYFRNKTETRLMMGAVNDNGNPDDRDESKVDKASVYIEVQNGTTIVGGAGELREVLRDLGWNVSFIGNNPDEDTPQTLVIYDNDEMKAAAEAVVADLGLGKVVKGDGEEYQFGTDLLVILGLDWEKGDPESEEAKPKE